MNDVKLTITLSENNIRNIIRGELDSQLGYALSDLDERFYDDDCVFELYKKLGVKNNEKAKADFIFSQGFTDVIKSKLSDHLKQYDDLDTTNLVYDSLADVCENIVKANKKWLLELAHDIGVKTHNENIKQARALLEDNGYIVSKGGK